jgi:HlyD family secretion protein
MILKKLTFYAALAGVAATAVLAVSLNTTITVKPPPIAPAPKPEQAGLAASGIIETLSENVSIGVPEPGLVTKVHVSVSDTVAEGAPLFSLDDRELTAQLAVHEANTAVAEATLRRLSDQLARLRSVDDPRAVSAEEVRTKENDMAVAEAEVTAAKAQTMQTLVRLKRLTVLAPRAGSILQVNIRAGEYAAAAPKSPAVLLGDMERLQVRADVDEQNAARLRAGAPAIAYLKGDATQPIVVRFVRIEPFVVPKVSLTGASTERVDTRVLQVIYGFERPQDRPLYVGQQVDLFIHDDAPAAVAAPQLTQTASH